jgi:hypothetical protein
LKSTATGIHIELAYAAKNMTVTELISNLSVADPHPTVEFDPLEPFQHSLSLVDRALVQSATMNASDSSPPLATSPLSTDQLDWAHRQLGSVNQLIQQHMRPSL